VHPQPGPIETHHGAPEGAKEAHQLAFRERRGVLAAMQLAIGLAVSVAIVVAIAVAVIHAVG